MEKQDIKNSQKGKQKFNQQQDLDIGSKKYILLTYRSKIQKAIPTTYYSSDSGWGCMLRVGQMLIANLIYIKQSGTIIDIIRLFYDNLQLPFSIQMFTKIAKIIYPQKKQFQWFSPCQCGFIIKQIIQKYDSFYRVAICNDNTMFLNQIQRDRKKILLMIMCRIGLDQPQQKYLQLVIRLTKNPFFFAIMGGTPKKAHLFLTHQDGKFGFLDPHRTVQAVENIYELPQHVQQYKGKLQWIKQKAIDTSMAICFQMMQQQVDQFWQSMQKLKKQIGDSFFIYMQRQRPQYDQQGIIEIDEEDF